MINYKRLTNKIAQELSLDYFTDPSSPDSSEEGFSEDFTQALDTYADLVDQNLDYINIVYVLKDQFGDELATQVLEFVTKNDMLARLKEAQHNIITWFAVSDGKETKVLSEDVYNEYWSDLFEAGFDVVGKFFGSEEEGEPSLEDPNWEWIQETTPSEDKWVLI